jgi:hypothetical protein
MIAVSLSEPERVRLNGLDPPLYAPGPEPVHVEKTYPLAGVAVSSMMLPAPCHPVLGLTLPWDEELIVSWNCSVKAIDAPVGPPETVNSPDDGEPTYCFHFPILIGVPTEYE